MREHPILSLFEQVLLHEHDNDAAAEAQRMARRFDPRTSHDAALRFVESGKRLSQHQRIVRAMLKEGMDGATGMEFERRLCLRAGRRLPELERMDPPLIRRGEPRVCTVTGEKATTWWLVKETR